MRNLSQQQIEAVLRLPGPKRYEHFVKQIADWEKAWGLYADGWAMAGADEGGEMLFPLWPAKEYAVLLAKGDWASYQPKDISLEDLLESVLPTLEREGTKAAVFLTPEGKSVVIEPRELLEHLRAEARKYE